MPRNTQTAIFDSAGNNATKSHLSTNIVIAVNGNVIGTVQEISISEKRPNIRMVDELGTDGHVDSAPNGSTNIEGTCKRIRFARMRMLEAFSRSFTHVHAQRIPFDIEIHDRFHDANPGNAIITTIKNVWVGGLDYTYSVSDWIITDTMSWSAEGISSVMNNGNVVGSTMADGRPVFMNQFEREADRGLFRGSLDVSNLLNASLEDPS